MTKARDLANFNPTNITDTGTEGTRVASGTTAQRGSTTGQWRFNTTTGFFEGRNATGVFQTLEPTPTITSVNDGEVDSASGGNQTIVISGTGFSSGGTIAFVGSSAEFNATTTTFNSTTQVTAVAPKSSFLNAQEPYKVKFTSSSGIAGTSATGLINVDNTPGWQTASGNLGTVFEDVAISTITVSATDADSDTVAYSVQSGSLPTGLSLNSSNGEITGTPNVNDTYASGGVTHTFDLRATANSNTTDRTFNILRKWKDGSTSSSALASATAIKTLTGTTTDGGYYIQDPSNSSNSIYAYCDMNFDGGGWILAHSSRSSTWDGQSGDQSYNNYFDSSHFAEYTSGTPYDVYSKLRTNYPFTELLIQWTSSSDMTGATNTTRPIYPMGSTVNGLINISANTQYGRKSGNSGRLPTTNYGYASAHNSDTLYYKLAQSSDDRNYMFSNYTNSNLNQGGFYGWGSGVHNNYAWIASTSESVSTVAFYVR